MSSGHTSAGGIYRSDDSEHLTNEGDTHMRIARKMILVAAMALAAMAFSAASASALTASTEPSGALCPALTATGGGCVLHAWGEVQLQGHVFGVESVASDCNVEFTGRVDSTGTGKVDKAVLTHHLNQTDCTRTPCNLPWNTKVTAVSPGDDTKGFTLATTFCVSTSGGTIQTCTVALPITESGHTYSGIFHVSASDQTNAPGCEVEGQLMLEGTALELKG
jgi:hypothetical protein